MRKEMVNAARCVVFVHEGTTVNHRLHLGDSCDHESLSEN